MHTQIDKSNIYSRRAALTSGPLLFPLAFLSVAPAIKKTCHARQRHDSKQRLEMNI
jgi:hypothetical protein